MSRFNHFARFALMLVSGCGEDGGVGSQMSVPDEGMAPDGGPSPDQGIDDEVFNYNFVSMWAKATVERRVHGDGSESLHGETVVDLSLVAPITLRAIEDVDLDADGVLTLADIHIWNTIGDVESEKRVTLVPGSGEVTITRPAGMFVWEVPSDVPWAYYHFASDAFLGYHTSSPVAAWVNARATEASDTVRGIAYDFLYGEPVASADLYQEGTLVIGADAANLDEEFVSNMVIGQLGDLLYRTDDDLGDLLGFAVPEGTDRLSAPDCSLPGAAEDFAIPSADGTMIAGTVNLPAGASGPLPFVVINFGTGGCDRDCLMGGRPVLACLAKPFLDAGIATVRYDDRGHGQSGGDITTLTFENRGDDAAAVAGMVAGRGDLDPDALFLLGWSEGVAHASVAAARVPEVDGLLFMAGVGQNFGDTLVDQGDVYLESYGMPQSFIDMVHNYRQTMVDQIIAGTFPAPPPGTLPNLYFQQAFLADGGALAAAGARPAAIFQGRDDWQVPEGNADLLEAALVGAGITDITAHRYQDVGHAFTPTVPGYPSGEEYFLPLDFDAAFLADLVAWINAHR